jgi:hypothetical protein
MAFVAEEDNMLALCEANFNTLVLPQDRGTINQFISQRDAGAPFLVPRTDGDELRRIWDYVEPQT